VKEKIHSAAYAMKNLRHLSRYLLALFFIAAGINHFLLPDFYLRMMPPYLPASLLLVQLSGIAEIGLGLLVITRFTLIARIGLIALLVAVFPANLHMALHPELFPEFSPTILLARLPVQLLFIGWVVWSTPAESRRSTQSGTKTMRVLPG
jgi:uncharacterized membrane protein